MKKVCGFLRSKFFAYLENEFALAEEEDIVATAIAAIEELVGECSSFDDKTKFAIAVTGAKLGVSGDGRINAREKRHWITCVQRVFSMAEKNSSPICTHCADNSGVWDNK
jgi:hypothetical protein